MSSNCKDVKLILAGNKNDLHQLSTKNAINQENKMTGKKQDFMDQGMQDLNNDGVDRRGFLKCMAWVPDWYGR